MARAARSTQNSRTAKLTETQQPQRRARRHVARIQHDNRTASKCGRHIARNATASSRSARSHGTNPRCRSHARIRKLRDVENPRRRRARVLEPLDDGWPAPARKGIVVGPERLRTRLEPLRASDETKIEKESLGVFARARLRPGLLFGARAGGIDAKPNARASGEIECGDEALRRIRPTATRHKNRSAINVAMRRMRDLQSRSPAKTGPDRGRSSTEQCRNFV